MTVKVSALDRYDALDLEEFRRIVATDAFKRIQSRIAAELQRSIDTCVRSTDQMEVLRAQGAVAALETAIYTPERIIDEMQRQTSLSR
jgi:hypothetical protein